jgi:single-stranded DNA-binding protein
MECHVQVTTAEPISLLLRSRATGKGADLLRQQKAGDFLLVSGTIFYEKDQPILQAGAICPSNDQQAFNDVIAVGRFGRNGAVSTSGKSIRRSLAIDKLVRNASGAWEKETDWIPIRAYKNPNADDKSGSLINRLESAPSGSLIEISGCLETRNNKDGQPYIEIKARRLKNHKRGGGGDGAKPDPTKGLLVGGYEDEDFQQDDDMPSNW